MNSVKTFSFILATVLLSGCYTYKPTGKTTAPDYNKRVHVSNAYKVKRGNALNITFQWGLIGAGAIGGYNMNLIERQTENGREPVRVANAAIGALAGAGIGFLIDQAAGKGKFKQVDPSEWIRKANKNYLLLNTASSHNFSLIHPSIESAYTVKNIQDVINFQKAFPNSTYTETVVTAALNTLGREDMPEILEIYPSTQQTAAIKMQYLNLSTNIEQCIDAAKTYPEVQGVAETKALAMVKDVKNAHLFSSYFSKDKNEDALFKQMVAAKISSNDDIILMFPNHKDADILREEILDSIQTANGICEFVLKYPNFNKSSICSKIATTKILKTTEDFKSVNKCLNNYGDAFIINALYNSNVPAYQYIEIMRDYTELDNSTLEQIFAMYSTAKRQEYAQCVSAKSARRMKSFIENYNISSPGDNTNNLNLQAKDLYEYWYCLESGSTPKYAEYAQKYPEKFNEMDDLAYKNVFITSTSSIDTYVRYFPNGKYVEIVKGKIPEAKAYEQKREYERQNELCHTCHGNGNCTTCNGQRENRCSRCDGKGYTTGWGDEVSTCYSCHGTGWAKCDDCGGSGRCSHCHGSGYQNR